MKSFTNWWANVPLALFLSLTSSVLAQPYPAGPVELVVGYPEGGPGDIVARLMAEKLPPALGQPVSIVHRPGASGAVAAESVVHAAPDGRTLLVGQTPEIAINRSLVKNLGYDPENDLVPVALVFVSPLALVVSPKAPYATADDLIEAARTSERGLTFASAGAGTVGQFAAELFRLGAEGRMKHLPLDGAEQAMRAVMDGRATFYFAPFAAAMPHVRLGRLKMLPLPQAPRRMPAVGEPGTSRAAVQASDLAAWVGIFAPRQTPDEVTQRLNAAVNAILSQPEIRMRLVRDGAFVTPMSADGFATFVKAEMTKYAEIIDEMFCSRRVDGACDADQEPVH
jgi:tripartite-type tricarboxylate transporter receptor subunit TctC